MRKALVAFISCLLSAVSVVAQPAASPGADNEDPATREQRHFLQCLAYVYSPDLWLSYNDALYFVITSEAQARRLEAMKAERAAYVALTDRLKRHELAAKALRASGIDPAWQAKLLLPFAPTNQNLTPTLNKPLCLFGQYKLLQNLGGGDVLIQDRDGTVFFVMNFGRGADDRGCTNGIFVKEDEKTYKTQSGAMNTVEALASAGLNAAERAILARVSGEFRREAEEAQRPVTVASSQGDREEFELLKSRASDSNPFFQYLVAKAYLEGNGTRKDETLAIDWMRRAAANGSGDAQRYLAQSPQPK